MSNYPIIANCNYESADNTAIHQIRLAIDKGLADDDNLIAAMDHLEEALTDELDENGEYQRGAMSAEILDAAEAAVLAAWTEEAASAVDAERIYRYRD